MWEPSGGVDRPAIQHANPLNVVADGSPEASTAGQPDTEPEGPMPDTECDDGIRPPSASGTQPAGRADAAPLANLAHHADTSAPGEAPPRDPPQTRATSETLETHRTRLSAPPAGKRRPADTTATTTLSMPSWSPAWVTPTRSQCRRHHASARSKDATMPRTHPSGYHARHTSSAITPPWGTPGMLPLWVTGTRLRAEQRTRPRTSAAPQEVVRAWKRAPTPLASLPARRRGPPCPRGGDIWTTHAWRATPTRPSNPAEQAAARDLGLWIPRLTAGEQLALAVRIRWLLISRSRHLVEGTRTMADITFNHQTGHTPPATMDHPGQWHYVATRLMAHMGAYNPDEMNGLHWQWHQRAALRIRATMQEHNIWDIPGSPGYQGHASGHQRPRSQDVPEPSRQAARHNSPGHPRGRPPGMGSPSGTYRSPPRPFAPRRGRGSPHTSGMQGDGPEKRHETRNPGRSRRRSRMPPPAARRVVFHEGMDRDHGGPYDPNAQWTSSTYRSPTPVQEVQHQTGANPHHSHASRARATGSASRGPRRAADGASSSSAASHPGLAADPLPGEPHATDTRPREPAADPRPGKGWGDSPPHSPPRERGAMTPVPDSGTDHPTDRTRAPRVPPPRLQHSRTAKARRAHRNNGSTTRAAQGRTQK